MIKSEEPLLGIIGNSEMNLEREERDGKGVQYRKKKGRNKSLMIKLENDEKLGMADMYFFIEYRVKVNRIEYKKIRRESLNKSKKEFKQKYSVLPSLN